MRRDTDRLRLLATFVVAGLGHVGVVALAGSSRAVSFHAASAAPIDVTVAADETAAPERSNDERATSAPRVRSDDTHADLETQSRVARSARSTVNRVSANLPAHADDASDVASRAVVDSEPAATAVASSSPSPSSSLRAEGDGRGSTTTRAAVARKPRLVAEREPCRGVFPSQADCDRGTVTLAVDVTESGTTAAPRIVSEEPAGQGFASAARLCSANLHFHPASDVEGRPVASSSVVRLRFER
jgi:hypothetical protein